MLFFRHSRESGNPVFLEFAGLPPAREWRPDRIFHERAKGS